VRRALLLTAALISIPAVAAPPAASRDVALLRAILWAFEPAPEEIRVLAIEDLGLLGDPRALEVLGSLLGDPSPRIQAAAVRAVRAFPSPRAEEILTSLVRQGAAREELRADAIEALAFQRSPSSIQFLRSVFAGAAYGARLQAAARRALEHAGDGVGR